MQALHRKPKLCLWCERVVNGLLAEQRSNVHPELRDEPDQPPRLLQPGRLWRDELLDLVLGGLLRRRRGLHAAERHVRGRHVLQRVRHRHVRPLLLRVPRRLVLGLGDALDLRHCAAHGLHAADRELSGRLLLQRARVGRGGGLQRADCGSCMHGVRCRHLLGLGDALDHRGRGADGMRLGAERELSNRHVLQRGRHGLRGQDVHGVRRRDVRVELVGLNLPHPPRCGLSQLVLGISVRRGPADCRLHGQR